MTDQDKYVVFKKSDWDEAITQKLGEHAPELVRLYGVEDAVVLRLQDVFTRPALYAYGNGIQNAVDIMMAVSDGMLEEECQELISIADSIIELANIETETKFPN